MVDEHAWVEQRMLGKALATLDDNVAERAEAHLATCARCRERSAELTAETAADPAMRGHLPAAMIARWDHARAQLTGLEREAVQQHVERCVTCRDELRLIGHEPTLAPAGTPTTSAPAEQAPPVAPRRPVVVRPRSPRWIPWLGGGAIGALAMAAGLLLMVRSEVSPTPALSALPWVSPGAMRGSEVAVQVPAGARDLALALAVPPLEGAAHRHLTVFAPDGALVGRALLTAETAHAGTAIVLLRGATALAAGTYRVVVRDERAAATADSNESFFELSLMP